MFNRISAFILLACVSVAAVAAAIPALDQITYLLYNQPQAGTGATYQFKQGMVYKSYQAILYQSGVQAASGVVSGSNDGINWSPIWTYSLTNTAPIASQVIAAPWAMEQATLTGISGVASSVASVSVIVAD